MNTSLNAVNVATDIDKPADSKTAEADVSVVHLTSQTTFKEGDSILVTCDKMVKIELSSEFHTLVSATFPTTIAAPGKFTISPTGCLGAEFARLWNNLPMELKDHILGFNLVTENPYKSHIQFYGHPDKHKMVLRHFAMGADIAPLAQRIFYEHNNFVP
jgi:hypothetical protein